jgi:ankyrin repeat protein
MDGTTALWAACVADDTASAELLLEYGSDINNQNDNGATVLMYAASTGKAKWVHFLLHARADDQLRSLDGYSALELAGTVEILRLLKRASAELQS